MPVSLPHGKTYLVLPLCGVLWLSTGCAEPSEQLESLFENEDIAPEGIECGEYDQEPGERTQCQVLGEKGDSAPFYDVEFIGDGQINIADSSFTSGEAVLDLDGEAGSAWEQLDASFVYLGEWGRQRSGVDSPGPEGRVVTPVGYLEIGQSWRELPYVSAEEIGRAPEGAKVGYYSADAPMNILDLRVVPLQGTGVPGADRDVEDPSVSVEVGETSTEVDGLSWAGQPGGPVDSHPLVYAAGGDERAELVVEFDGLQQRIDLHSGERIIQEDDPAASYYSALLDEQGMSGFDTGSLDYRIGDPGSVTITDERHGAQLVARSPWGLANVQSTGWVPDRGWADPGEGWLTFDFTADAVVNQADPGATREYDIGQMRADIVIPLVGQDDIELTLEGRGPELEFEQEMTAIPGDLTEVTFVVMFYAEVLDGETGGLVDEVTFSETEVVFDTIY